MTAGGDDRVVGAGGPRSPLRPLPGGRAVAAILGGVLLLAGRDLELPLWLTALLVALALLGPAGDAVHVAWSRLVPGRGGTRSRPPADRR